MSDAISDVEHEWSWYHLKVVVTPTWLDGAMTQTHINMAMTLLENILMSLFGKVCITSLCASKADMNFFLKVNSVCKQKVNEQKWKRSTSARVLCTLKKILSKLKVSSPIVKSFQMPSPSRPWNIIIGKKYGRLSANNPVRQRLDEWINIIRSTTNARSELSLRNIMSFYLCNALPALDIKIEDENMNTPEFKQILQGKISDANLILKICGTNSTATKRLSWLKLLCEDIFKLSVNFKSITPKVSRQTSSDFQDGDVHRISKDDLETLYKVAIENHENEMMFMMLLTTGMRIGAYAKMKVNDVADIVNGKWSAKTQGKTIEKGAKYFTFKIHPRVQELLVDWLNKRRGFNDSAFVFPGKFGNHLRPDYFRQRFSRMCHSANLKGKEFHPHALRHCYAHILLDLGNTAETISKLINHSSVSTTQKHYLKETAAEISAKAIVPWMPVIEQELNPVPYFLQGPSSQLTKKRRSEALEIAKKTIQKLSHYSK